MRGSALLAPMPSQKLSLRGIDEAALQPSGAIALIGHDRPYLSACVEADSPPQFPDYNGIDHAQLITAAKAAGFPPAIKWKVGLPSLAAVPGPQPLQSRSSRPLLRPDGASEGQIVPAGGSSCWPLFSLFCGLGSGPKADEE